MLCSSIVSLLVLMAVEASWALTEEEKTSIVDEHNKYRAAVSPPASFMLKMSWDSSLEDVANKYAQQCIWAHNPNRGSDKGENLFYSSAATVVPKDGVDDWYNEKQFYTLSTMKCADGKECGHYTQVMWAKSDKVGCGAQRCEKVQNLNEVNVYLMVCNYSPAGNVVGEPPYTEGTACSKCSSNYKCVNSLCESGAADGQNSETSSVPGRQPNLIVLFAVFLFASLV